MATGFQTSQAQLARYGYERLLYTGFPFAGSGGLSSLAAGSTPLFTAQRWNPMPDGNTWQSRLEMIQTTQNPNVSISWVVDSSQASVTTASSGYPVGVRPKEMAVPSAASSFTLALANASASAIAGYQMNYSVGMRRLTAADKALAQQLNLAQPGEPVYQFNQQEISALAELSTDSQSGLAQLQDMIRKGTFPMPLGAFTERLVAGRVITEVNDVKTINVVSGSDTTLPIYPANLVQNGKSAMTGGVFPILRDVSVSGAPNVIVNFDSDSRTNYMQLYGAGWGQANDAPWKVFLPSMQFLNVHVGLGPGNTTPTTVYLGLRVQYVAMSEMLAVLMGLVTSQDQLTKPKNWAKAIVGIV